MHKQRILHVDVRHVTHSSDVAFQFRITAAAMEIGILNLEHLGAINDKDSEVSGSGPRGCRINKVAYIIVQLRMFLKSLRH